VRLGIPQSVRKIPIMQREQFKQAMEAEVAKLQKLINKAGYSTIKASAVGSTRDVLAFLVPYETKMFEGALSPRFAKAADLAQKRIRAGYSPNSVIDYLQKTYGFTAENAQNIIQYLILTRKIMMEGTMPGPSDQGGASTPPPHTGPSSSISAPAPDTNETEKLAPGTDQSQQGDTPDPKQMLQQNPDLADFFAAMAKMKPEEIQSVTQMFTEGVEDEDAVGDVSTFPEPAIHQEDIIRQREYVEAKLSELLRQIDYDLFDGNLDDEGDGQWEVTEVYQDRDRDDATLYIAATDDLGDHTMYFRVDDEYTTKKIREIPPGLTQVFAWYPDAMSGYLKNWDRVEKDRFSFMNPEK